MILEPFFGDAFTLLEVVIGVIGVCVVRIYVACMERRQALTLPPFLSRVCIKARFGTWIWFCLALYMAFHNDVVIEGFTTLLDLGVESVEIAGDEAGDEGFVFKIAFHLVEDGVGEGVVVVANVATDGIWRWFIWRWII